MTSEDQVNNAGGDINDFSTAQTDLNCEKDEMQQKKLKKELDELMMLRKQMESMMKDVDEWIKLPMSHCDESFNEKELLALTSSRRNPELKEEDYECAICLRLLFEPVTVRCGHSFCRSCCQSLFRRNHAKCPLCQKVLPLLLGSQLDASFTLAKLLESSFPKQHSARLLEHKLMEMKKNHGDSMHHSTVATSSIPIFHLDPMLPRQEMSLNIFEPRHVLMITRCIEGSRRFGMMGHRNMQHGVEAEIIDSSFLRDGRIHVKVRASNRRFVIRQGDDVGNNTWIQDGHTMANIQWLFLPTVPEAADADTLQGSEEERLRKVMDLATALEPLVETWKKLVENGGWQQCSGQLRNCLQEIGPMPRATNFQESVDQALWVGALINPLPGLGVASEVRPSLLLQVGEGDAHRALENITAETQRSIKCLRPNEFFHWIHHCFHKASVHGTGSEAPPPAPSLKHVVKAMTQIILVTAVVSSLMWHAMHQLSSNFLHKEL